MMLFFGAASQADVAEDFSLENRHMAGGDYVQALAAYESFVEVIGEILDADVFINIPIAKHHNAAEVTLSMKNLMGINWNRGRFHQYGLHQPIADLNAAVRPDLIVMDANRILMTNGPSGPGQTRDAKTIVAGTNPVAVDAYTVALMDRNPMDIGYIRYAYQQGVGEIDVQELNIDKIEL